MRQIAELIGPLITGQLIKQYKGTGSSHLSELTAQQEIVHHKPLWKVFVFCKATATLGKQIAGGLVASDMDSDQDHILQLCLCNLCQSTPSFHVGRQEEHSKQCFRYFGEIKLVL